VIADLARLGSLAGRWRATYELRGDPRFDADVPTEAVVSPILAGTFVQIAYRWTESGTPQEGLLLVGLDPERGSVTAAWLDTWHNGHRMMVCAGEQLPDGGIDVFGTYPGRPGERDWGWRTRLEIADETWTMRMFNVTPDGVEAPAVTAVYGRA
jgi:hypothetical protein